MTATPAWLAAVEALLNRGINSSARGAALVHRLADTALRVDAEGLASIRVSVQGGRLALIAVDPGAQDDSNAVVSGPPLALFNLARARSGHAAPVLGADSPVQVRGDAEVVNAYRELITLARPDLEDELSRLVGDFPA